VAEHGQPLVEDPARLDGVTGLGLDETSFLRATPTAPTRCITGLVDVEGGRLLDVIADRATRTVTAWLGARSRSWLAGVGLVASLGHTTVVVDHFHAIKLANTIVDQTRRRTQQALLGHRGRKPTRCTGSVAAADRGRAAHQPWPSAAARGTGRW
jgi:hypothetical protein